MEELIEEYPQELEKHLPCKVLANGGPLIDNEVTFELYSSTSTPVPKKVPKAISTSSDKITQSSAAANQLKIPKSNTNHPNNSF